MWSGDTHPVTKTPAPRPISPDEAHLIAAIISRSREHGVSHLVDQIPGAVVVDEAPWIIDITPKRGTTANNVANGPLAGDANVSIDGHYQGEIIIWIRDGYLNGLEYAWVTDEPPTRWPRSDEIEMTEATPDQASDAGQDCP